MDGHFAGTAYFGGVSLLCNVWNKGKASKTIVVTLSKFEDPDGKLLYEYQGIGEKAAKNQYEELMVFAKRSKNHVTF